MPDLLLELFSEEIPARMQARARDDLRRLVTDGLVEAGLTYASAGTFSTPRRLVLTLEGLSAQSRPVREERKGPRTDAPEADRTFVHLTPAPGSVFLWESWLRHEVPPNRARTPRISISFNYAWG